MKEQNKLIYKFKIIIKKFFYLILHITYFLICKIKNLIKNN
jgi:hypothetical protein